MKKKVDPRVRALIEACVASNHRSLFVIVGDKGRHQVVNLHYILSKATVKARPSVLWCYKRELGFSSHKQKRMKQLKKMAFRAGTDLEKMQEDPFELFISSTKIRYCYYSETHKVLGNTFGMCILQDFEALTPNLLARTIETVEGGGVIVLLLKTMSSLKQLYSLSMDVHARYRTEAHSHVTARFNERFILSLGGCKTALVVDDELNVLPLSSSSRAMLSAAQHKKEEEGGEKEAHQQELADLVKSLQDSAPMGALVGLARTVDQAKAVLSFMEAVSEKSLRSTVALTAGRGRGKSAALGISIAAAVAYGYSNIFVTSPSPENLQTLFEFVLKAFDALEYKEHLDYQVVQSTNPSFNGCIVRINVFHSHRQTIQYIQPEHGEYAAQAELVVVDEAAAIPLPLVKKLMGPYLLFLSSTVNGYEGTGRSLSLKLIQQLREQQAKGSGGGGGGEQGGGGGGAAGKAGEGEKAMGGGRLLREIKLEVPIRYSSGDQVEGWLHSLLCLDCTDAVPPLRGGCPAPAECELYWVDRDTLFSYHRAAEDFLQGMMSLYVASHYKNSPNDLQLLSDAPAHQIFVLLGPVELNSSATPDILCVLQVCLEGQLSRDHVLAQLSRGIRASGDLIPWTVSQQFQDPNFASLSGARVVRIATHPQVTKMGYGSRALELLTDYFQGKLSSIDEGVPAPPKKKKTAEKGAEEGGGKVSAAAGAEGEGAEGLLEEKIAGRKELQPLLVPVGQMKPEARVVLDYLGVSYGLTPDLDRFWRRSGFKSVYVRQISSDLTGEHTCICLRQLRGEDEGGTWLAEFETDFKRRFVSLLGYEFRSFPPSLPLAILEARHVSSGGAEGRGAEGEGEGGEGGRKGGVTVEEVGFLLSNYDLKRLESYANNIVDHHIVLDLVPTLARLYFTNRLPIPLSFTQAAVLLGVGLQLRSIDDLAAALRLEARQLLANFNKALVRISKLLRALREAEAAKELPTKRKVHAEPLSRSLADNLEIDAKAAAQNRTEQAEARVQGGGLGGEGGDEEYAVGGGEEAWTAALEGMKGRVPSSVSLPSTKKRKGDDSPGKPFRDPREVDPPPEGKRSKGKQSKPKKSPK